MFDLKLEMCISLSLWAEDGGGGWRGLAPTVPTVKPERCLCPRVVVERAPSTGNLAPVLSTKGTLVSRRALIVKKQSDIIQNVSC